MPVEHAPPGPGGGRFLPGGGKTAKPASHSGKAPAPTFAQLQQWLADEKAGKPLTAEQKAALHAAHEAHLAHLAHLAREGKAPGEAKAEPKAHAHHGAKAHHEPKARAPHEPKAPREPKPRAPHQPKAHAAAKPPPPVMPPTAPAAPAATAPVAPPPPVAAASEAPPPPIAKLALPGGLFTDEDDDLTALYDADLPRIDLVGKGANGIPRFLIAKQDEASAGLLPPDYVRSLIAKTSPEEAPVPAPPEAREAELPNGIVLKGSPAAMAAFIHAASVRQETGPGDVAKAKNDAASRKHDAATGAAMSDGSYPIENESDLHKAIRAVGRGGASHDAIRRHVITRAKSLGASSAIPDNWNSDGSLKSGVSKEAGVPDTVTKDALGPELDDATDDVTEMDPTIPLAEPEDMGPGDPTDPGSPAWESIDSATAAKWLSILARAENALCMLAEREMIEAASADPGDMEHAFDLEDARCAIRCAIETLAVFAAQESIEAELGAEMAEIGKAAAGAETPVCVIEGLTAVMKAGRVLSASNEAAIRAAAESLQKVLASLPEAPVAKEAAVSGTQARATDVAKETASPEAQAKDAGPVNAGGTTGLGEPRSTGSESALPGDGPQAARPGDVPGRTVVKSAGLRVVVYDRAGNEHRVPASQIFEPVTKADGDAEKPKMQAVFDQDGDLIGVVDPDAITPVAGAAAPAAEDTADEAEAAPAADDMTPQPPADAGTPADENDVAKQAAHEENTPSMTDVLKSITEGQQALAAQQAAFLEAVAKAAAGNGEQAARLEEIAKRLAVVEEQPAMPKVFTSGQVPPAHMLRGQDQGTGRAEVDIAKARERKAELYAATGPDQARIAKEMTEQAADYFAAMRAGR